ncbi:L-serine ammonia-lyase [Photobacterium sanguinicancri]|uniref:L-serine ammonia-lyase n=1 Tax=Photobacterium sanguinicancri TaxID=875932 RepID=UPI00078809D7|nr:L-serine ammonia-lyase [Photobacterium sanguinicancri]KXI21206.1 serine dehydratase [Photobacterium sanguinicancri]
MLSIFDIYKIGVGPSSSHTNGPMIAGYQFCQKILPMLDNVHTVRVDLYGSLSLTGKGHHTDRAVFLGLMGNRPDNIDIEAANSEMTAAKESHTLLLGAKKRVPFQFNDDIVFHTSNLPLHENGMTITALDNQGKSVCEETYYSIGGGFIATADEMTGTQSISEDTVTYPFKNADEMLAMAERDGLSLGALVQANEMTFNDAKSLEQRAAQIWQIMSDCMHRGFQHEGILEGGLHVTRRAPALLKQLESNQHIDNDPMTILDWVNLFAFAVSEENAAGGQVVTSPTNGAAGVIPAVLMYYNKFIAPLDTKQVKDFLAVSAAIGMLYKTNASISGAEVGCQGEVGVSSSMAAAGLTALRGGSNEQICMAAEIAMEHSLGMTCDPIGGLVQIPCIERNAMGAMKAINASRMALKRNSKSLISLDKVIATMYQTGKDMNKKYRETSLGGLAVIHLAPPCE